MCTRDLSILGQSPPARRLGRLLGKGLNHIPLQPWDREEAAEALSTGLWEGLRMRYETCLSLALSEGLAAQPSDEKCGSMSVV